MQQQYEGSLCQKGLFTFYIEQEQAANQGRQIMASGDQKVPPVNFAAHQNGRKNQRVTEAIEEQQKDSEVKVEKFLEKCLKSKRKCRKGSMKEKNIILKDINNTPMRLSSEPECLQVQIYDNVIFRKWDAHERREEEKMSKHDLLNARIQKKIPIKMQLRIAPNNIALEAKKKEHFNPQPASHQESFRQNKKKIEKLAELQKLKENEKTGKEKFSIFDLKSEFKLSELKNKPNISSNSSLKLPLRESSPAQTEPQAKSDSRTLSSLKLPVVFLHYSHSKQSMKKANLVVDKNKSRLPVHIFRGKQKQNQELNLGSKCPTSIVMGSIVKDDVIDGWEARKRNFLDRLQNAGKRKGC